MGDNSIQQPRYTSTPRAGRETLNALQNFSEVSPIFPAQDIVRKAKSSIPILLKTARSTGDRSSEAKAKGSTVTSNNSGEGSSGSVKIPPQACKSQTEKKKDDGSRASCKNDVQIKPPAPKSVPSKETRSSVDKVSEDVAAPSSVAKLPPEVTARKEEAQSQPRRMSKVAPRPSTLPAVPEETALPGSSQILGEDIFKSSTAQTGWLIPKETKNRTSLKRKSNVQSALTKRVESTICSQEKDGESLFDSPELPNLIETTSLVDKRKTHVIRKKPKTSEIQLDCVTDGVVPEDCMSEKTASNTNMIEKGAITPIEGSNKQQSKGESGKVSNSENLEKVPSPDTRVKKKRKTTSQLELKKSGTNKLPNKKRTETSSNNVQVDDKLVKSKDLDQEINLNVENNAKVNIDQSKENKKTRKTENPYNSSKSHQSNAELLENNTRPKRALRERKACLNYEDTSAIDPKDEKITGRKKKKEQTIKSSQEVPNEVPTEVESHRKKTGRSAKTKNDNNLVENEEDIANRANTIQTFDSKEHEEETTKRRNGRKNVSSQKNAKFQSIQDSEKLEEKKTEEEASLQKINVSKKIEATLTATKITKRTNRSKKQNSPVKKAISQDKNKSVEVGDTDLPTYSSTKPANSSNENETAASPKIHRSRKTATKICSEKHSDDDSSAAEEVRKTNILYKKGPKSQSRAKTKSGVAAELSLHEQTNERRDCPGTERGVLSSGKKRKSEEMDFDSHSGPGSSSKRSKCINDKDSNAEAGRFNINDLFGTHKITTDDTQPGVRMVKSLHIQKFLMMGEVTMEPGAVLTKISTNTGYTVLEGNARVTIKKVTRNFKASDEHRRFFIPRNIDVSIINNGGVPLKMEFFKFRGNP